MNIEHLTDEQIDRMQKERAIKNIIGAILAFVVLSTFLLTTAAYIGKHVDQEFGIYQENKR